MKTIMHLLSSSEVGGAEVVAIDICQGMQGIYNLVYVSPEGPIRKAVESAGVRFIGFDKRNPKKIREIIKNIHPDVIHAHDFKAIFLAKILSEGIPVIAHIHHAVNWESSFKDWLAKIFLKRCQKVIFVSNWAKNSFRFSKKLTNFMVIENCIDIQKVRELGNCKSEKKFDILFVGRLEPVKDPKRFISIIQEILKEVPNVSIGMIGKGSLESQLKQVVAQEHLNSKIIFLGFQSNPYKYMSRAKLILSTSSSDAFGLTVIEAASLGVVSLVPKIPGIGDVAKIVGSKVYNDNFDAVQQIVEVLSNKSEFMKTKEKLRAMNFAHFDRPRFLSDIKQVYQNILS